MSTDLSLLGFVTGLTLRGCCSKEGRELREASNWEIASQDATSTIRHKAQLTI